MSEDRLEKALEAIKSENVSEKELAAAHDRVLERLEAPGEARLDWQILCDVMTRMGYPQRYRDVEEVFVEMSELTESYRGLRYRHLEGPGKLWPCPGAPIPEWLVYPAMAAVSAWYVGEWVRPRRGALQVASRAIAIIGILSCLAAELPWHFLPAIAPPEHRRLYVVGDLISAGLGHAQITPWPAVLQGLAHIEVSNLAIAGANTETALRELDGQRSLRGLVLVEIGGNDMFGAQSPEDYARHLDALLSRLGQIAETTVMIELPVLPGSREYAVIQRRLARKHQIPLIPKRQFACILTEPGSSLDGVHLTQQGHNAMARWAWSILAAPLREAPTSQP